MYKVNVQHYGEQVQIMDTFNRRALAERYMLQQAEIVKGYENRTGMIDGQFIVFGEGDIFKTRMWVSR